MPMKLGEELPSLKGATEWINEDGSDSRGPILVHFWSISCYLCKKNFAQLRALKSQYAERGLKLVAVHMPRQEEDTDVAKVRDAISEFSLEEPCAIDNQHELKNSFKNEQGWVPAYFLFDAEGKLRSRSAGENGIALLTTALQRVLPDASAAIA